MPSHHIQCHGILCDLNNLVMQPRAYDWGRPKIVAITPPPPLRPSSLTSSFGLMTTSGATPTFTSHTCFASINALSIRPDALASRDIVPFNDCTTAASKVANARMIRHWIRVRQLGGNGKDTIRPTHPAPPRTRHPRIVDAPSSPLLRVSRTNCHDGT